MAVFKKTEEEIKPETLIANGTSVEGTITSRENLRVEGVVKGSIMCEGRAVIGSGARVEADICADTVLMSGEVYGNIVAKTKLEIATSGKLKGNIKTGSLIVAEGVLFEGNCQMIWEEREVQATETASRETTEKLPD